jgi:hypothetical protein
MVSGFATQATSASHFRSEPLADFGECRGLGVGNPESTGEVGAEDQQWK